MKLSRWRRVLAMVAVPLALFISLVAWGFSSPIGSSPDDDYHMASIWCGQGIRDGLCEPGDKSNERRIPAVLLESPTCYAFNAEQSASCPQKPSSVLLDTNRGNFAASYPPIFYGTLSIFAGPDVAASVLLMRTFNALLFVGVSTALFFALARNRRGPLLLAGLVTIVPLGMFLIPSVNPSSWAITSAFTLWIAVLGFFQAEERRRKIIFAVIAVAMTVAASGARSDAAVYSVIALLIAVVIAFQRRWRQDLIRIVALPAVIVIVAAVFFLSSGQSTVLDPGTSPVGPRSVADLALSAIANLVLLPQLWVGVLGTWGLGWLDTILPGTVWVSMMVAFFGLVFWGLQKMNRRKAVALVVVFATLVVVPLYILVKDDIIVGAAVQPRYVYPLIIMLAGIALLGFTRADLNLNRLQLGLVALLVIIANTVALHFNIRRYVTGVDDNSPNLDSKAEWWWGFGLSPMGVWILGSAAFATAVIGVVLYLRKTADAALEESVRG